MCKQAQGHSVVAKGQVDGIEIVVVDGITCTNCGATECVDDPTSPTGKRFNIRAFKVGDEDGYWWSECLICKEWF